MITLPERIGAMALHMMHERDWTMVQAVAWVNIRIAEAQEDYRQAGTPLGDTDEGFVLWLSPRHQPPTA